MIKILIIDDDIDLTQMLSLKLKMDGYDVLVSNSPWQGVKHAYEHHPNLIILDVNMPGADGFQICQNLRQMTDTPILMLTARSNESDIVKGFYQGADDYVVKPFHYEILESRIRAILRRPDARTAEEATLSEKYADELITVDPSTFYILSTKQKERLTPNERKILTFLITNREKTVTYQELSVKVWGSHDADTKKSLAVHVNSIRGKFKKLCQDHEYIQNQWGIGYMFVPNVSAKK